MIETFEVQDKRDQPFYIVDDVFLKRFGKVVGPNGIAVYNALCMHANKKTGESWPSRESIHEVTGLSVRAISTALKVLARHKLIIIQGKTGSPNHYFIQPVPENIQPLHQVQAPTATPTLAPGAIPLARPASPPALSAIPLAPGAAEQELRTRNKNKKQEQEVTATANAAPTPAKSKPNPRPKPSKPDPTPEEQAIKDAKKSPHSKHG